MVNYRTFAISGDTFSHFTTQIDLDEVENINDIIQNVVNKLMNILKKHNLVNLSNKLNRYKYHTHDYTFEDVLMSEIDRTFYICNHDTC
tara:strand:+ start:478 stop:744 length:267 start_codon:yes stop_codon:yes gene_type:complete